MTDNMPTPLWASANSPMCSILSSPQGEDEVEVNPNTTLWRVSYTKPRAGMSGGHTIIVSNEHRLEVAVCPLPVQDERRLTDMTAVEKIVTVMCTGDWQL
jgi:hypothetical protein